ncbi:MAG: sterol desaturase family protein [Polyangiaceae bacterium]
MSVFVLMGIVMGISGLVMSFGVLGYKWFPSRMKIHEKENSVAQREGLMLSVVFNSTLSTAMLWGWVYLLEDTLLYKTPAPIWRIALEAVAVLLFYDFFYYFLHRYPFHEWKALKKVHAIHHRGKYPTALDSLYLHPVEAILGVVVFNLSVLAFALIGGISVWSYAIVFLLYTQLNIIVHWGIKLKTFPLNLITYMSVKHDRHHKSMREGNYASITPLPDLLFGTMAK